ncbi:hypothetical protein AQUCO_03000101v1 [Aquilegia coerulea]|uniref:RNA polymerase sigma-70 region 2 domain-containing protein n=1 Tax=Aquilegia coerulea TaxID=218851 RepID=A0A2G5D259_AQUCA|nr:hypothetical protein AQUCO_03000101v1 [Aquilegia coerulea]
MEAGKQLIPSPPLFLPKTHLSNSLSSSSDEITDVEPGDTLSLAKKAVIASKEAASLFEESNLLGDDFRLGEPFLGSELARLEEVKKRLQSNFGREPTLAEWAEVVGTSCLVLQMTCANFRLVVHVAKHYQGWGMNLQDLLQEESKGLMRSIEKFKLQAGCRFSTYAYWWIRQSIRTSIFNNSRTIRLLVFCPSCF